MDIDKMIDTLKQHGVSCVRSSGRYCGICDDAATALSTLQAENEKLRAELERMKVERDAYQVYFKDLSSKPDCNTCEKRSCEYKPRPGAIVRVNCPLYSGPEKED